MSNTTAMRLAHIGAPSRETWDGRVPHRPYGTPRPHHGLRLSVRQQARRLCRPAFHQDPRRAVPAAGGRIGGYLPGLPRARVLLLDHTGAKSGIRQTSPVMYHRDGEVFVVVASKAGQPTNPAWFHNLMANLDPSIQIGSEVRSVHARVAGDDERARLWPEFVSSSPATSPTRATRRTARFRS